MLKGDLRRATVSVRRWFVAARGRCASTPHSAVASYCSFTATPASDRWVLKLMLMPDL